MDENLKNAVIKEFDEMTDLKRFIFIRKMRNNRSVAMQEIMICVAACRKDLDLKNGIQRDVFSDSGEAKELFETLDKHFSGEKLKVPS